MTLTIVVSRHKRSRRLSAHVVQGAIAGVDLLSEHTFTRVSSAETAVRNFFRGAGIVVTLDVQASPGLERPYQPGYDRNALLREVRS